MNELIKIKSLSKFFYHNDKKIEVLKNINLSINNEDFISIIGPSGMGKTTFVDLILGLLKPTSGRITYMCNEQSISLDYINVSIPDKIIHYHVY